MAGEGAASVALDLDGRVRVEDAARNSEGGGQRLGDAPQFCLWVGDRNGNAGACTSVEDFAENGMLAPDIGGVASGASQRYAATWLPSGKLVLEERDATPGEGDAEVEP